MSSTVERDRWALILDELAKAVSGQQYETWFRSVGLRSLSEQRIELDVPSKFLRDWLLEYYLDAIKDAAQRVLSRRPEVAMSIRTAAIPPAAAEPGPASGLTVGPTTGPRVEAAIPGLNPRYTFDTFVVGESNRMAH